MLFAMVAAAMLFSCTPTLSTEQSTYTVEFDVDYNDCGVDPQTYVGGVDFGSAGDVKAGRVCSKNGYKNISKIEEIGCVPLVSNVR